MMKKNLQKQNTPSQQSQATTVRKPVFCSHLLQSQQYFPRMHPRHYNWVTIKQLVAIHHHERQDIRLRKMLKLPYKYSLDQNQKIKSEQTPQKERIMKVHPLFQNTMYNNRRTHQFFNIKKRKNISSNLPEGQDPLCLTQPEGQFIISPSDEESQK